MGFRFRHKDLSKEKKCKFLRSGTGGRGTENMIASLILVWVYIDQFLRIVYAIDTNKLPAARDLCSRWQWLGHEDPWWIQGKFFQMEVFLIDSVGHNTTEDFEQRANPARRHGICK